MLRETHQFEVQQSLSTVVVCCCYHLYSSFYVKCDRAKVGSVGSVPVVQGERGRHIFSVLRCWIFHSHPFSRNVDLSVPSPQPVPRGIQPVSGRMTATLRQHPQATAASRQRPPLPDTRCYGIQRESLVGGFGGLLVDAVPHLGSHPRGRVHGWLTHEPIGKGWESRRRGGKGGVKGWSVVVD